MEAMVVCTVGFFKNSSSGSIFKDYPRIFTNMLQVTTGDLGQDVANFN
jgi:hypothetical protein